MSTDKSEPKGIEDIVSQLAADVSAIALYDTGQNPPTKPNDAVPLITAAIKEAMVIMDDDIHNVILRDKLACAKEAIDVMKQEMERQDFDRRGIVSDLESELADAVKQAGAEQLKGGRYRAALAKICELPVTVRGIRMAKKIASNAILAESLTSAGFSSEGDGTEAPSDSA